MKASVFVSAFVASIVGFGSSLAVILAAADALNATMDETSSWVTALCLAVALSSIYLSARHRMPLLTAWSTPGAVLIASAGLTISLNVAVGAFIFAAVLIFVTGLIKPIERLIAAIPGPIASAMLAGVLMQLILGIFPALVSNPTLVASMIFFFFLIRLYSPSLAVIGSLVLGFVMSIISGSAELQNVQLGVSSLTWITPEFEFSATIGLGLPLYLVTMTSQNIAGFAVMKSDGYQPPTRSILTCTSLLSAMTAFFGAHTSNLAAITASICTGKDTHPDPNKRWVAGVVVGIFYLFFALFGASLVSLFTAVPKELIATLAGLALLAPLVGAAGNALSQENTRLAATVTLLVTLSGLNVLGISAAFWGLLVGIAVYSSERFVLTRLKK